jgi:diaminopimelate decarboxylase
LAFIDYINDTLAVEGVTVSSIAKSVGTPFYCYSTKLMLQQYRALEAALKSHDATIYYAVKANSNLAVIKTFSAQGAGADVVSLGELQRCLLAGVPAEKIVFAGVGKTREEISEALKKGVFQLNVESESELRAINEVAMSLSVTANVGLRVNPDVDAETHEKITTGKKENKFGVDLNRAPEMFFLSEDLKNISLKSLSVHIGSQLTKLTPYREAYTKLANMTLCLRSLGFEVDHLDLGGGLGIPYGGETSPDLNIYNDIVTNTVGDLGCKLGFEPGRYLIGEAGILVTKVIYIKSGQEKRFVIVDAAMNDLIRPTLYDGYHDVITVQRVVEAVNSGLCDVVGPICESGDYLAKNRVLPYLNESDLLAVKSVGAYGAAMSSTYNSRPLIPEVLVNDDQFSVIRKRQSVQEAVSLEKIPKWLEVD